MAENNIISSREENIARVKQFTLMSDVFMSVALQDIPACQHVLRILTGIKDLIVTEVRTQYTIPKTTSHDARLDVLAEDSMGKLYNIEIQRTNTIDHARRTRFYGSMIDSEFLAKGKSYDSLPDVHIIYISEQDLWKKNRTVYPVKKMLGDPDIPYDDGIYVSYINTAINDGSEIAALMQFFTKADPNDNSQGELSKRIHFLKCEEGGQNTMCEITQQFFNEGQQVGFEKGLKQGVEKGMKQGVEKGRAEERLELIRKLMKNNSCSVEQALKMFEIPENEYERYKQLLQ